MGEHIDHNVFRIVDVSIQGGGSFAAFIRKIALALDDLKRFFARTNYDYRRFNYLGEWHSHPSFEARPSPRDVRSMLDIIADPRVGAEFVVLMIVKLDRTAALETSATVFVTDHEPFLANIAVATT